MMDATLVFCEKKEAKAAITSEVIDFGHAAPTTGLNDRPLYVVARFPTALTGKSLVIALEDSADGKTFAPVLQTGALAPADVEHGVSFVMPVKHRRYVRIKTTPTEITAGTMTAYLTDVIEVRTTYKVEGIEFLPGGDA